MAPQTLCLVKGGGGGGGSSPVSKWLSCHHQPCVLSGGVPALCLSDCHITLIMCFVREVPTLCLSDCYVTTNPVSCQGGGGGQAQCLNYCHVTTNPVFCQGGGGGVPALCLSDCHITLIMCFVREVPTLCLSDCYVTTNPVFCQGGGGSSPVSKWL